MGRNNPQPGLPMRGGWLVIVDTSGGSALQDGLHTVHSRRYVLSSHGFLCADPDAFHCGSNAARFPLARSLGIGRRDG
jgi:hypothetical protein